MAAIRVFVSHASEDKDRFVRTFATKLRERGIDAWVDEWEIRPGDSIVDKIFEQGIGQADAVIVVVSSYSVDKRWVRVELNTSVIKRIEGKVELIPVVIDDCSIPDALKDILHVRIRDIQNYDAELDRIIDALHGEVRKPALGQAPAYSMSSLLLYLADVGDLYEETHVNSRCEWDVGYEELRRYNAGTSPRWQLESLVRSSGGVRVVDGVGVCSGCAGGYGREAGGGLLGVAGALRTVHNR